MLPFVTLFFLTGLFMVGFAIPVAADDLSKRVDTLVQPLIEGEIAVGLSIGLVDGDKVTVLGYGHVSDGKSGKPDGDTVYEIGSMTKVFTGILLADMIEGKQIGLDDPVAKLLPDTVSLPRKGDRAITLLDLATHTSGLASLPNNFAPKDPNNPYADYTVAQMYAFLSKHELPREPGAQYEYSNLGAGLLGHILARKANLSYEELVTTRLCTPLGMKETRITLTPEMKKQLAQGHNVDGDPVANWDLPTLAGAGALRSNVNDMILFLKANLGLTETPLRKVLEAAQVSRRPIGGNGSIGLGWHITPDKIHWHNGGTGGYHTFMAIDREKKQGVVVLCNSSVTEVDALGINLMKLLAGKEVAPPKVRKIAKVKPDTLETYVGAYELAPNFILTVTRNGDKLLAQATGQPRFRIYPESDMKFYYRVVDAQVTFVTDTDKKVEKVILHQNGNDVPGKKIK
jgi:serine-type D-Ala-D-Ala carboxypeptidase/endopeptidase